MRYWCWPPCDADGQYVDKYNWSNMPDAVDIYSPQDQIDCVAAASHSVGVSLDTEYACEGSYADFYQMEVVFKRRRYHDNCNIKHRPDYSADEWFTLLKNQFNINRPVVYRVTEHAIVGDGWREILIDGVLHQQYHMNYGGWGTADDTWYDLDNLPLGGEEEEYVVRTIFPEIALGDTLSGVYEAEWTGGEHFDKPTRYFDQDCTGVNAEFKAGQALQYVRPGLWVRCTGTASDALIFRGASGAVSEVYRGAPFGDVKIRILDGAIKLHGNGAILLERQ
jgi:hypothetical protein